MRKKKKVKIPPKPFDEYPVGSKTWVEIRNKEIADRELKLTLLSNTDSPSLNQPEAHF